MLCLPCLGLLNVTTGLWLIQELWEEHCQELGKGAWVRNGTLFLQLCISSENTPQGGRNNLHLQLLKTMSLLNEN